MTVRWKLSLVMLAVLALTVIGIGVMDRIAAATYGDDDLRRFVACINTVDVGIPQAEYDAKMTVCNRHAPPE